MKFFNTHFEAFSCNLLLNKKSRNINHIQKDITNNITMLYSLITFSEVFCLLFCEMFNSVSVNSLLMNLALMIVNQRTQHILLKIGMDGS